MDIFVRRRDKERLYLLECDLKTVSARSEPSGRMWPTVAY